MNEGAPKEALISNNEDYSFRENDDWKSLKKDAMSYFGKNKHMLEEEFKDELLNEEYTFVELLEAESDKMADAQYKIKMKMRKLEKKDEYEKTIDGATKRKLENQVKKNDSSSPYAKRVLEMFDEDNK